MKYHAVNRREAADSGVAQRFTNRDSPSVKRPLGALPALWGHHGNAAPRETASRQKRMLKGGTVRRKDSFEMVTR